MSDTRLGVLTLVLAMSRYIMFVVQVFIYGHTQDLSCVAQCYQIRSPLYTVLNLSIFGEYLVTHAEHVSIILSNYCDVTDNGTMMLI